MNVTIEDHVIMVYVHVKLGSKEPTVVKNIARMIVRVMELVLNKDVSVKKNSKVSTVLLRNAPVNVQAMEYVIKVYAIVKKDIMVRIVQKQHVLKLVITKGNVLIQYVIV
jgi:hypothetical protein